MARGDQLSRQWKIIQALTSARQGKSAAQLAGELDCHSRTVYRDLEALQAAGFPLLTEKKDGRTRWLILESNRHQPPIPLSLTELMALHFSRHLFKSLEGTYLYDSLVSLFDKVRATLPQPYQDYLKKAEHSIGAGTRARNPQGDLRAVLTRVHQAVQERRMVAMRYFTMSRRAMTNRRVNPYKVWFYEDTFYVIGHCHTRQDVRVFALDRIAGLDLLEETFEIPDTFDAQDFMGRSFGIFHGPPVEVAVHFTPDVAGYIRERVWHPSQHLETQSDGSLVFKAEVAGLEEIKYWILKWGKAATVLYPDSLRAAIAEEAMALLRQHQETLPHAPK